MPNRPLSLLAALVARIIIVMFCGFLALIVVNGAQEAMLSSATSFDIAFDRLGFAMFAAAASGVLASIALLRWQADRFTIGERLALSLVALLTITGSILALAG